MDQIFVTFDEQLLELLEPFSMSFKLLEEAFNGQVLQVTMLWSFALKPASELPCLDLDKHFCLTKHLDTALCSAVQSLLGAHSAVQSPLLASLPPIAAQLAAVCCKTYSLIVSSWRLRCSWTTLAALSQSLTFCLPSVAAS